MARHVTDFEYWMDILATYWWKLSSGYPHLVIKVEIFTPAFERIFPIYDVVAVYGRLARWADDRPTSTS